MKAMAKRALQTKKTPVDPLFAIPPGSEEEFVFSRESADIDLLAGIEISEEDFEDDDEDDGDDPNSPDDDILDTPEDFTVISQTLRRGPGGQQVVDIVIEAEEVVGAINYEIQVTKL